MKDQITKMTVEVEKMRISDFAVEFIEDEKAFEEGWVHCYVEILDEDGDVVRGFEAKSGIHFCGGGSLFGSVHNQGLNDVVEEAMEQYLDHPGVKAKLIAVYEEGLRLAAEDGEDNEDDEDSGIDAAVQFLKTYGAKIVHADSEEIEFHSYGDSKTLFQTPHGWIVAWPTQGGVDWQGECPDSFQRETGLRWAACRDPFQLPKFGVETYQSALSAVKAA